MAPGERSYQTLRQHFLSEIKGLEMPEAAFPWINRTSHALPSMTESSAPRAADRYMILAIGLALGLYAVSAVAGWPQAATQEIVHAHSAHAETEHHATEAQAEHHENGHAAAEHSTAAHPAYWAGIPFACILLAIAVFPLIHAVEHWWESNLHRLYVALGMGACTLGYYAFFHAAPVEGHWPAHYVVAPIAEGIHWGAVLTVLENAILSEYVPFIVLLFSLYTIAGGIRIEGDLRAHPATNTAFIAIGGLLASFLGTTGAAMLLIRPLLETNRERKHVRHTVIFFIFVVCNCGGLLLPIGDPPLFLGYLRGVPFLWTMSLWQPWLFVNGCLLGIYLMADVLIYYPREAKSDLRRDDSQTRRLTISGLGWNGPLLVGVIFCVALLDPSKAFPGTNWHAWMFLREAVQLGLVGLSLLIGSSAVRRANRFNYHAIAEVAALFIGIFICMQPVLQILDAKGDQLGIDSSQKFFWVTGSLSSVLDNAPTYLVFFETARAQGGTETVAGVATHFLVAISLGAVFMGAMTYIGNGPNFMVKAIAETSDVSMPSFFGYTLYSCAILLPVLALTTWIFL